MIEQENFIGIYENAYSKNFCEKTMHYFEQMNNAGFGSKRKDESIKRDDLTVFPHGEKVINFKVTGEIFSEFYANFWDKYYKNYADQFSVLQHFDKHNIFYSRIQKTTIGGGYHVWHCEDMTRETSNRVLAWMLYLNDVEEGGETEFLYQHKRVKAKQGTLVIWPAAFTHTHRGNPPISNDKYVITGWVEF